MGALYDKTNEQVNQQSQLLLAQQLRGILEEIGREATDAVNRSPNDDTAAIGSALQEIGTIAGRAPTEPDDKSMRAIEAWSSELRELLSEVERVAEQALQTAWSDSPSALDSRAALLDDIKRQTHQARRSRGTVESAEELFANMSSISTTVRKVGDAIGEHKGLSLSFGLLFVALLVFTWLLLDARSPISWDNFTARGIAGAIALIASVVTLLGPPLKVAAEWSKKVSRLFDEYQGEAEAERQRYHSLVETRLAAALAADEQVWQKELSDKMQAGQQPAESYLGPDGQPNLASMDYQIDQLELEADELRRLAGPPGEYESLLDFIKARQDEQFYEKRLGLMHQVKRDIDILTGGLVIQPQDEPDVIKAKRALFPRGPARVVLYIDDLDRCPPQRVVEVLEAVQLLLDTELFVVVMGLDTRYITRALEKEYKEILQPDGDPSGLDYIEKIVQLPYRVRPIGKKGIEGFLKAQMQIAPDETLQGLAETAIIRGDGQSRPTSGASADLTDRPKGDAEVGGSVEAPAPDEKGETPPGDLEQDETGKSEDGDGEGEPMETPADGKTPTTPEEQEDDHAKRREELPPEIVRFRRHDLEDLTTICRRLKLTPRNVKRMVNVLKLINVFWFRTGRDLRERKVKSTVMGLLALAASYPEIMREVFEQIDISYRNSAKSLEEPVGNFLDIRELPSTRRWREQHESLIERFRSDVRSLYQADNQTASLIAVTLNELQENTFNLVRSFSFVGDPVYLSDDDSRISLGAAGWSEPLAGSGPGADPVSGHPEEAAE